MKTTIPILIALFTLTACSTREITIGPAKYKSHRSADLPSIPFWRKYGKQVHSFAAGTITSYVVLDERVIAKCIARGDTYAVDRNGPWLPFTKEVME